MPSNRVRPGQVDRQHVEWVARLYATDPVGTELERRRAERTREVTRSVFGEQPSEIERAVITALEQQRQREQQR